MRQSRRRCCQVRVACLGLGLTRCEGGLFLGLVVPDMVDFGLIRACMPLLASRTCLRNTGPSLLRCPSRLRVQFPPELFAFVPCACIYSLAPATTRSQTCTSPPYSCSPAPRTRTCTSRARARLPNRLRAHVPPCTVYDRCL